MKLFKNIDISTDKKILFFLFIICLISFYPVFNSEYLTFDDQDGILNNNMIPLPFTFNSLIKIFTSLQENQYTPLSIFTFWLEYNLLLDFNSSFSHIVNLIIHLLGVFALYYFSKNIFNNTKYALILTTLWAIHPIQVSSVAWLTGRRTLLYGTFLIISLFFYTKYIILNKEKKIYYHLAIIAMILSCLSKTLAFTIPIIFLFIDWLKNKKIVFKNIFDKTPLYIISIVFVIIMFMSANSSINRDSSDKKLNNIKLNYKQSFFSIGYYFFKTLYPSNLSATNELNDMNKSLVDNAFLFFIPFIVVAVITSIKSRLSLFGLLFYLIHIFPLSGLIRVGHPFYAQYHYCYVPLIGLLFIIIESLRLIFSKISNLCFSKYSKLYLFIFLSLLIYKTIIFCNTYNNSESLFLNSIKYDKYDSFANDKLIFYYISRRQCDKAELYCNNFISISPFFSKTYFYLALVNIYKFDYIKAIELLEKAIFLKSDNEDIIYFLGYCNIKLQNWVKAENYFNNYLNNDYYNDGDLKINLFWGYSLRALARQNLMKYQLADKDFLKANLINPNFFQIKVKLFQNSMQMMDYYNGLLRLTDIYGYINNNLEQVKDIKNYYEVLFFPSTKESLLKILPYYTYLESIIVYFF